MKEYKTNNNIAFLADSHFGVKSFNKNVFETTMNFFETQFFPWCLENGIEHVIHCGDVVHNRNIIDLWINQELKKRFFRWFQDNNIKLHVLVGNHDMYYKSSTEFNYLAENVKEFDNIIVYDDQEKIKIGKYTFLMVPWIINKQEFQFKEQADICCGHFETVGFKMTSNMYAEQGFEIKDFKDFKYILSGHFHIRSHQGNVYYLGSQYPINWNDFGETKGFYVLKDDFQLEFIENTVTPKFLKLYYNEIDGEQTVCIAGVDNKEKIEISKEKAVQLASSNYYKVITENVSQQSKFDTFYKSISTISKNDYNIEIVDSNEIIENFNLSEIEDQIKEESDVLDLVSTFLDGMTFEGDINKKYLFSLFKDLYIESADKVINE